MSQTPHPVDKIVASIMLHTIRETQRVQKIIEHYEHQKGFEIGYEHGYIDGQRAARARMRNAIFEPLEPDEE